MPTVVVIRPGCTDFDEQHRIQGALDRPLNPRGEEQVRKLVDELKALPLECLYSAPGEPARSTAEEIGRQLGIPVKTVKGLQNLNQGLWQGLQIEDIRRKFPRVFKQWQETPEAVCPPEGETIGEAVERIRDALRKPLKRKEPVGIVASDPLATLIACLLKGCRLDLHDCYEVAAPHELIDIIELADGEPATASNAEIPVMSPVAAAHAPGRGEV